MNDLDTLRPEVRESLAIMDRDCPETIDWQRTAWGIIRAELLRLAGECAMIPRAQLLANFAAANERAEKAESELATAQNVINAQQDTMGALKKKLSLSEGELATLKARMAAAHELDTGYGTTPSMWGLLSEELDGVKLPESLNTAIYALRDDRAAVISK